MSSPVAGPAAGSGGGSAPARTGAAPAPALGKTGNQSHPGAKTGSAAQSPAKSQGQGQGQGKVGIPVAAKSGPPRPTQIKPIKDLPATQRFKGLEVERGSAQDRAQLKDQGIEIDPLEMAGEHGDELMPAVNDLESGDQQELLAESGVAQEQGQEREAEGEQAEGDLNLEILGQKFKTRGDLETFIKRANGRASAAEKRAQDAGKQAQDIANLNAQWEAVWKEATEAGLVDANKHQTPGQRQQRQGQVQAQGQQGQDSPAEKFIDTIPVPEWHRLGEVAKTRGVQFALAEMADRMDQHVQNLVQSKLGALRGELNPMLEPVYQQHVTQHNTQQAQNFWVKEASHAVDASGAPLFPELVNDPQAAQEVSQIWLEIANRLGKEVALSDYGVQTAYLHWKNWRSQNEQSQNQAAQAVTHAVQAAGQARAQAAASAVSGPSAGESPTGGPVDPRTQIRRDFKFAGGARKTSSTGISLGRLE